MSGFHTGGGGGGAATLSPTTHRHVCMYIRMCTYVCMYVCMYVCQALHFGVHTRTQGFAPLNESLAVHLCTCMHTYKYIRTYVRTSSC